MAAATRLLDTIGGKHLVLVLSLVLLVGCGFEAETVLSSRTSPDGSKTARILLIDDDFDSYRLILEDNHSRDAYVLHLKGDGPGIFLRWLDNDELELWWPQQGLSREMPNAIGPIRIVNKSYDESARPKSGVPTSDVSVQTSDVHATFQQYSTQEPSFRRCELSIKIDPNKAYDSAAIRITIGASDYEKPPRRYGFASKFTLGAKSEPNRQTILTSATVSDIPFSTNRLPDGDDGTMVRGQFLEGGALTLMKQLKQSSIQIRYSREFFQQIINYDVPMNSAAAAVDDFFNCVDARDADFRR